MDKASKKDAERKFRAGMAKIATEQLAWKAQIKRETEAKSIAQNGKLNSRVRALASSVGYDGKLPKAALQSDGGSQARIGGFGPPWNTSSNISGAARK